METERNYFIVSIKNHSVTAYPLNFLILFIVVIALFSSFYTVEKNENAVITTLGKYEKTVGPGVHGKIPFIQKSDCIDVTSIRREEFGFRTSQEGSQDQGAIYTDVIEESSMLTGDDTIAVIDYVVQYQVQDPVKWLFNAQQPELIIRNLSMSSTRLVIGYSNFDDVATSGKEKIQLDIKNIIQTLCDEIDLGVRIVNVMLQDVIPPSEEVRIAYKKVNDAMETKQRMINEAKKHANKVIPNAEGEAAKIINEALTYKTQKINDAKGNADRFLKVLAEYNNQPELTRKRMILETLQNIQSDSRIVIDTTGGNGAMLKHFEVTGKQIANDKE